MQITGGKVTFTRGIQPAQFETKKAEVEISFTLAEGEELGAGLDRAAELAQGKALELVGLKKPAVTAGSTAQTTQEATPKTAGPTKADLEAEKATELAAKAARAEAAKGKAVVFPKADDGIDMTDADKPAISTGGERVDPAEMSSDDDLLMGTAPEVSDVDLTSTITRKNHAIKNPTAIKALIGTFVVPPKGSRDIPQALRADFLAKLELLEAAK